MLQVNVTKMFAVFVVSQLMWILVQCMLSNQHTKGALMIKV